MKKTFLLYNSLFLKSKKKINKKIVFVIKNDLKLNIILF